MKVKVDLLNQWDVTGEKSEKGYSLSEAVVIQYPVPEGAVGMYDYGFEKKCDAAFDAMHWYGLSLDVEAVEERVDLCITARFFDDVPVSVTAQAAGEGIHRIHVGWKDFQVETSKADIWRFLTGFEIKGKGILVDAHLRRADWLYVQCPVLGKSAKSGEKVEYQIDVTNCTEKTQMVVSNQEFKGWESIFADIQPTQFLLEPSETKQVTVTCKVHEAMVPGGYEDTIVRFIPNGDSSHTEQLTLKTMCYLPHPYIIHDLDGWEDVKKRVELYAKYEEPYQQFLKDAEEWEILPPEQDKPYCYDTYQEHYIMSTAYAYAITNEKRYAVKVAQFLLNISNPNNGYPKKLRGCSQSYVQEGHFFQHLAIPYDIIYEAGVLTKQEHQQIQHMMRIYMETLDFHIENGHISNWLLSEIVGGLYCAMTLQDMNLIQRFVFGNGGAIDELTKGAFNDGWWHECSVGYNIWVSSMFIHMAHAMLPFGYNLIHEHFQIPYNDEVSSNYADEHKPVQFGMYNRKWGGNRKNYICIKDLFDAAIPFLDYRCVMFGVSDSFEKKIEGVHFGSTYNLAYTYYKDPEYIRIIKRHENHDPVFGHPELPMVESRYEKDNAFADNIGIAMLRSQTPGREQREQIQAVLRYGSHGGAHGHFDTTGLLSVMRYGRNFYNPEMCWWGYPHFMYKFYVQNSTTKNMVTVDGKMQVPHDSKRKLFYSGQGIQAVALEIETEWSYPPYAGMVYNDGKETLEGRTKLNASSLPMVENGPEYGELSEFTEPMKQVRVMAVTDDYIVLFDYVNGDGTEHRFDNRFQIKGFKGIEGKSVIAGKHTGQLSTNPISDEQFVTDCQWYETKDTTVARFETIFGPGEDLRGTRTAYNEDGVLKMDVHSAWPKESTQVVGMVAESIGDPVYFQTYTIPLSYHVDVDGTAAAQGEFGAWLLGLGECDVDITGAKTLSLHAMNHQFYNEQKDPVESPKCLFWGEAYVELADGSRINITELNPTYSNVDMGYGIGKDYEGGRVALVGNTYPEAIPTHPENQQEEAVITVDLTGVDAVRFVGCIGVDNFPGEEEQRRKMYAIQSYGTSARYVTVIEPYEKESMIASVTSEDANTVRVLLKDGREQWIVVNHIENDNTVLSFAEYKDGKLLRKERTDGQR